MQLFFADQAYIWSVSTLIHVHIMVTKRKGKVEFGEGLYFIFLSTQKKDRKKRVLNMAKLQFHIKIVLFTLFVNCFLVFVDLTIKMVVKMNSKSRFIYSSFFCLEH